jgi:hypothetical protein
LSTGVYTYIATITAASCTLSDTLTINVVAGEAPDYLIAENADICAGASVDLGGAAQSGTTYAWSSNPVGFTATDPNPSVTPAVTTRYYLSASNQSCPFSALDSVLVPVFPTPVISLTADTAMRFAKVFGTTPEYWMNLQRAWDLARAQERIDVSDIEPLAAA